MRDLFGYFGQSDGDVICDAALAFAFDDPAKELREMDRALIVLAKFANLPPEWTEQQDIVRQNQLLSILHELIETQRQTFERSNDKPKEWQ